MKFAQACPGAGISPILGVDLAVEATGLSARLPDWAVPPHPVIGLRFGVGPAWIHAIRRSPSGPGRKSCCRLGGRQRVGAVVPAGDRHAPTR